MRNKERKSTTENMTARWIYGLILYNSRYRTKHVLFWTFSWLVFFYFDEFFLALYSINRETAYFKSSRFREIYCRRWFFGTKHVLNGEH